MGSGNSKIISRLFFCQGLWFSFLVAIAIPSQQSIWIDRKVNFGFDYVDFYDASTRFILGSNPYQIERFNKPPLVVLANIPLALLSANTATFFFFMIQLVCLLAAVTLAIACFTEVKNPLSPKNWGSLTENDLSFWLAVPGAVLLSYPVFFVLDRGNLDGIVAFFCFLGFFLWVKKGKEFSSGMAFAVAIGLKIYPAFLLVPLIVFRKFRILAGVLAVLLFLLVMTPELWQQFLTPLIARCLGYHIQLSATGGLAGNLVALTKGEIRPNFMEYGSLASTLHFFYSFGSAPLVSADRILTWLSYLIVMLGFLLCCALDYRNRASLSNLDQATRVALYIPFIVSVPLITFHYEFVFLLPAALAFERAIVSSRMGKWYFVAFTFALTTTQLPVNAIASTLQGGFWRVCFIPGFAVAFLMFLSLRCRTVSTVKQTSCAPVTPTGAMYSTAGAC